MIERQATLYPRRGFITKADWNSDARYSHVGRAQHRWSVVWAAGKARGQCRVTISAVGPGHPLASDVEQPSFCLFTFAYGSSWSNSRVPERTREAPLQTDQCRHEHDTSLCYSPVPIPAPDSRRALRTGHRLEYAHRVARARDKVAITLC